MATLDHPRRESRHAPSTLTSGAVAVQCVASMAGTLIGESLGPTLAGKLVAGALGAGIGAFLAAPGGHRRRRIVAVGLFIALVNLFRKVPDALASDRRHHRETAAWLPANWAVVGIATVAGFAGGSAVTTARGAWTPDELRTQVTIPDLRGQPRDMALAALVDRDLEGDVVTQPSESVARDAVTRTDPPGGSRVDRDATITVYVSAGPPSARVRVPNVTGQSRAMARAVLADAGLRPRSRREASETIAEGAATRTEPPAGTTVRRRAGVTLFVSSGPVPTPVTVPDVEGRSRGEALELLRSADLRPATRREASESVPAGDATRTDPPAGAEVSPRSRVALFVSSGPAPVRVEIPDVAGLPSDEAVATLEDHGLRPSTSAEPSESVDEGVVTRTVPNAGVLVDEGEEVTVFVSSGPVPLRVPDVAGDTWEEAKATLEALDLTVDDTYAGSETVALGVAIRTKPPAGTEVSVGDKVIVVLSCGAPACVD